MGFYDKMNLLPYQIRDKQFSYLWQEMELYFPFRNREQLQGYTIPLYIMTEMVLLRDDKVCS